MRYYNLIFILALALNAVNNSTSFLKVSFKKDKEEKKEKGKPIFEKFKNGKPSKFIESRRQIPDAELQNEFVSSIDYVFDLVTVALRDQEPIWMNFQDEGLMKRLTRRDRCSRVNKRLCERNRQRKRTRRPPRRPNNRKPSFTLEGFQRSQPLKILEKRSLPQEPPLEILEKRSLPQEQHKILQKRSLPQEPLKILEKRFKTQEPLKTLEKRFQREGPIIVAEQFDNENYNYDDDYMVTVNVTVDDDYEDDDTSQNKKSGNVVAIPLQLISNGKLITRKGSGFYAGAIPFRVAPIILATDPENRQASDIRLILKGKIRFNFFQETNEMSSELYLVNLVTADDFEVVMKSPVRRNKKVRRAPDPLRLRFQRELNSNKLRSTIETNIADLMRKILKEENAHEAFYFGDYGD